jgi:hypothetical protein
MRIVVDIFLFIALGVGFVCAMRFIASLRREMEKLEDERMRQHVRGRYDEERWWSH